MSGIFISYRQDDAKAWALLLRDKLAEVFGEEHVFVDKDTLHAGNWRQQIRQALSNCRVMLVIMGGRWLTIMDKSGQRCLDRADDVHRFEIASALSRDDVTVIPVRVGGAAMPLAKELPEDIRLLTDQQSRELSDSSARRELDLKLLIADIERVTGLRARKRQPGTDPQPNSTTLGHKRTARTFIKALVASFGATIALLVMAQIGLGWTFDDPQEISFLVLIILGITIFGARLWARRKEKNECARN